ncbi:MAG: hypothetical protein PWP76_501 [Candidatus Diapherotrites archaeon]|nr:hypothetical protein [Candidatus Diapherotrites archaeon]MDN5367031.1 hypothetical protein [Candidatus Diapherotrites archaeon]
MKPLRETLKKIHPFYSDAAEGIMEYFEALHQRDFERAEQKLKELSGKVSYYDWAKMKPWGPFKAAGETEGDAQRRWNEIVNAIGHAIWPKDPRKGIEILEKVAWTREERAIYRKVKEHYVNRKVPRSMVTIYRLFKYLHEDLVRKIRELEAEEGKNHG